MEKAGARESQPVNGSGSTGDGIRSGNTRKAQHVVERSVLQHKDENVLDCACHSILAIHESACRSHRAGKVDHLMSEEERPLVMNGVAGILNSESTLHWPP